MQNLDSFAENKSGVRSDAKTLLNIEDHLEEVASAAYDENIVAPGATTEGQHNAEEISATDPSTDALQGTAAQARQRSSKQSVTFSASDNSEDEDDDQPAGENSQPIESAFARQAGEDYAEPNTGFFSVKKHRRICGCFVIVLIVVIVAVMFTMKPAESPAKTEAKHTLEKTKVVVVKHIHEKIEKHGEGCVAAAIAVALCGAGLLIWGFIMCFGCCCYATTPLPQLPDWGKDYVKNWTDYNLNPPNRTDPDMKETTENIEDCEKNAFSEQCASCYEKDTRTTCNADPNNSKSKSDNKWTVKCKWNDFDYRPYIKPEEPNCCASFFAMLLPCCCGPPEPKAYGPGCKFTPCGWIKGLADEGPAAEQAATDALKFVCGTLKNQKDVVNDNTFPLSKFGLRCQGIDESTTGHPTCPKCASNAEYNAEKSFKFCCV